MKRTLSIVLAMIVLFAFFLTPSQAFANEFSYTAVRGGTTTLDKYLVMDKDANVPNATFNFSIAPGTAIIDPTDDTLDVFAGLAGATITASVAFAPADTTYDTVQSGDTLTLGGNQKYAVKTLTADFSAVSFPEPGLYRYIITEAAGTEQGVTYDPAATRTLDVYVVDNGSGVLSVSSYVLHTNTAAPAGNTGTTGGELADKSTGYTNVYSTKNLSVSKTVSGSQASRDKYFKITVALSNAVPGTVYTVDLTTGGAVQNPTANAATKYTSMTNPTSITVGTDGSVSTDFYLQSGQEITILGLATSTSYAVTEDAEDYVSSLTSGKDALSGTIGDANVSTGLTNTRDGTVPTGIMLSVVPGVVIITAALVALILLKRKKSDA